MNHHVSSVPSRSAIPIPSALPDEGGPESAIRSPQSAILLLGPTGSGKSPLGDYLEQHGLAGHRCVHFDFGANLRETAAGRGSSGAMSEEEAEAIRRVLASGALLEDHEFPIAKKVLGEFLRLRGVNAADFVVLNGFPRHAGQARDMEDLVTVALVVYLQCPATVVKERIRLNSGGDRAERVDDAPEDVDNKLRIFEERTAPLMDYYSEKGGHVISISITAATTALDGSTEIDAAIRALKKF